MVHLGHESEIITAGNTSLSWEVLELFGFPGGRLVASFPVQRAPPGFTPRRTARRLTPARDVPAAATGSNRSAV
ncbi:hypothetical protein GCM10010495_63050 [Kitasatospora herbaricolor]|nr:hypothetical protein GCM10010495_63050 [Kitasatospora herbaricolor]